MRIPFSVESHILRWRVADAARFPKEIPTFRELRARTHKPQVAYPSGKAGLLANREIFQLGDEGRLWIEHYNPVAFLDVGKNPILFKRPKESSWWVFSPNVAGAHIPVGSMLVTGNWKGPMQSYIFNRLA